ncbi:hypothetical protein M23134_00872 [Microscilla marina ATCC 23134]|uniref:DUF5683 domain-containing protein n=1 Tax=Microscilla marina ATCC 23134 TaxID=313606 RepID=A1ZUN2_MICM2|nr:hypothetical protein M23134_00872 [Microscilla marina ATCC 23134]
MFCTAFFFQANAQLFFSKKAVLKYHKITLDTSKNTITLNFDLQGPANRYYVTRLYYSSNNARSFKGPLQAVNGDVGDSIRVGNNKSIAWSFVKDNPYFSGKNVIFKIESTEIPKQAKGGPRHALKSLLLPGWGDYKVRDGYHYEWIPTAAFTLLGTGVFFRFWADHLYEGYDLSDPNSETAHQRLFQTAQSYNILSQVLLGASAIVWLGDVLGVYLKGRKNLKKYFPKREEEAKKTAWLLPAEIVPSIARFSGGFQLNILWRF